VAGASDVLVRLPRVPEAQLLALLRHHGAIAKEVVPAAEDLVLRRPKRNINEHCRITIVAEVLDGLGARAVPMVLLHRERVIHQSELE
jgi:serine/threonine protein kinase